MMLTKNSTLVASKQQVSATLAADTSKGAVILGLSEGKYFELNEVGARIWNLIQQPRSVQSIVETLMTEYDVDAERCESDVYSLANQMLARSLIEIRYESDH